MNQSPIACDMSAIPGEQREAHERLARNLLSEAVLEQQELPDGYAFRFGAERYQDIVAFIANERYCCSFYRFVVDIRPEQGPIWLQITGREGVKELLGSGIDHVLSTATETRWSGFLQIEREDA